MQITRNRLVRIALLVLLVALAVPLRATAETPRSKYGLGLIPSEGSLPQFDTGRLATTPTVLPNRVDLSVGLPPIGDQGYQGSCVGWATGYYYKTYQERMERQWDISLPQHQFSPAWIYNQRSGSCLADSGMSFYNAFLILRDRGAAPLASFPYAPSDSCQQPSQAVKDEAWTYRAASFDAIFTTRGTVNLGTLKTLLANGETFVIAVPVYSSFYDVTYDSPVVPRHATGETYYGGHAMFVVGYDDAVGALRVANSWGTGWGRDGFCYLSYDFVQYDAWEAWIMDDYIETAPTRDLTLHAGWNLISLPLTPDSLNLSQMLAPIAGKLEAVYSWDRSVPGGRWLRYAPQLPGYVNSLAQADLTRGLWLKVTQDCTWQVEGAVPTGRVVALGEGWNLVAYPGAASKPISEALASIAGKYSSVLGFGYESGQGVWKSFEVAGDPSANTLQTLEPGYGYWVQASEACTWSVN